MFGIIEKFDLDTLLIVSFTVTLFCVAILKYTPAKHYFDKDGKHIKSNDKKDYFVMIAILIVTIVQLGIVMTEGTAFNIGQYALKFIFTWAFSLLFYKILGMLFIKRLFDKGSEKLIK